MLENLSAHSEQPACRHLQEMGDVCIQASSNYRGKFCRSHLQFWPFDISLLGIWQETRACFSFVRKEISNSPWLRLVNKYYFVDKLSHHEFTQPWKVKGQFSKSEVCSQNFLFLLTTTLPLPTVLCSLAPIFTLPKSENASNVWKSLRKHYAT